MNFQPRNQQKKTWITVAVVVVGLISLANQRLTMTDPENTYPKRVKRALRLLFNSADTPLEEQVIGKGIACEDPTGLYLEAARATVVINTDGGTGAGVFIGPELIATARHVVEGQTVTARFPDIQHDDLAKPGKPISIVKVEKIEGLDLAFIQTRGRYPHWLPLETGEPEDSDLMVVGHPNRKYYSLQKGRIKKKGMIAKSPYIYFKDNEIFFGNSGGTIISCSGRLVGVVSMMSDYDNSLRKRGIGINSRAIAGYAQKLGLPLESPSGKAVALTSPG